MMIVKNKSICDNLNLSFSNFSVIDELKVFLLGHKTYLPVEVVQFVSSTSFKNCVKFASLPLTIFAFKHNSDLCPLFFRK